MSQTRVMCECLDCTAKFYVYLPGCECCGGTTSLNSCNCMKCDSENVIQLVTETNHMV